MKQWRLCAWLLLLLAGCAADNAPLPPWYPAVNAHGDPVFAVFESRIPCVDCEKIKFALALYTDPTSGASTTYQMARIYVGRGNDRTINEGNWSITRGTSLDPQAVVYQLDGGAPEEFQSFWAIGADILFILDENLNPRVGTAGYGYALNRQP